MNNEEEDVTETHTQDFDRQVVTDNEPKAKRVYAENKSAKANNVDAKAVRAWALTVGEPVARKGRIHRAIVQRYISEAHNG